jgi:peptidase M28-like protein
MSRRAIGITCWLLLYSILTLDPLEAQTADDQSALAKALESISRERLLSDISTLSGPEFNGRQAGSRDDLTTALWFQEQFQMAVQHPLDSHNRHSPSALPESTLTRSVRVSSIAVAPVVQIGTTPDNPASELGSDYLPILDSPSIDLRAQIAFVGYGIADPASGFDEYNGIDVHNRIVLFLRGKPEHYAPLVSHADKVRTAKAKGAVGYLTATGPLLSAYETRRGMTGRPSALYGLTDDDMSLSGAWINTDIANRILTGHEPGPRPSLRELQETINRTLRPQSRMTDVDARLSWLTEQTSGTLYTLPITFPSAEADAGEDMIIIGAHRDHFGRQAGLLFPGADDNASGTAVLLEVARVLKQADVHLKRNILFLSFSGEEQGLLGSRLYVEQPLIPLKRTKAMINIDHVGVGNGRLTVGMTGFEKSVAAQAGQAAGLGGKLDLYGFFPGGDHVPFKEAGVPTVTVVSAGVHPQFHQSSDRVDTLDPEILVAATRYVLALTWQLAIAR